jgi:diguanylate cyclase (GGDEF)-like protein
LTRLDDDRFSFEPVAYVADQTASVASQIMPADKAAAALALTRQISYRWDIASDAISWSADAKDVLGFDPAKVSTGRQFATLMDNQNFFSRYDTVMRSSEKDEGSGVAYDIEYRFKPDPALGTAATWIEDQGRWFAGENGEPSHAIGVMRVADERHMRDQQMSFLSNCDPLTGMMNRARMTEALGEAIEVAKNDKRPCAFAIIAVNNLAVMNEAYGFEVADEVIVALSQRLRRVMRMGDGIARYSGSKFGIILNNCKQDELEPALERFMRAVRDSVIETRLGPVWALLSIGSVSLPALGETATEAIAHAEEAMSEAFRLPSDGYVIYHTSDESQARRLLNARCAAEIVNCLRDGLFKLAFQPAFDSRTGEVLFHEALLRMADQTGQLITAAHLVPIAERLGLIRLIDRAVLQLALQTLQSYPDSRLSVNISATTVTDPRWNAQLIEMIAATPRLASRLVVEITETAALENRDTAVSFAANLCELGCGVALDDFGAGYTSYRNLKELPLTHIKLDGSFCSNLSEGSDNRVFVESMVELAHAFKLKVIAEWVNTEEDAKILASLGVDGLQGNYLGEASIAAPWTNNTESGLQLEASSLAPVDAKHFSLELADIAEPRTTETAEQEEPAADVFAAEPTPEALPPEARAVPQNLADMDDATLDQEIASLGGAEIITPEEADAVTADYATPAYETALVQPEDDFDVDQSLERLRATLAELGAAFGTTANEPSNDEDRHVI